MYASPPFSEDDLEVIKKYLFNNISTSENVFSKVDDHGVIRSIPGVVIASPSVPAATFRQDYLFHWVRDGAITMMEIIHCYLEADSDKDREKFKEYLMEYLKWVDVIQQQPELNRVSIYGEPKFNIDGSLWTGVWSRPQNDGAGLRAISTIAIANILMNEGQKDWVRENLYITRAGASNYGVIKNDLEYIANHWGEKNSGLWEEIKGYHFFTEIVQRKALIMGAELADKLGDKNAANYYSQQVKHIELLMNNHWNDHTGYYSETLRHQAYKGGGVNSSIIIGFLYGRCELDDSAFCIEADRTISSAYFIRNAFEGLFQINFHLKEKNIGGPLIGRYPNDLYDGNQSIYGNPWPLATALFAEYYYLLAASIIKNESISINSIHRMFFKQVNPELKFKDDLIRQTSDPELFKSIINSLLKTGDDMLKATNYLSKTESDGSKFHLAEQVDRSTCEQVSAMDLTWNYAAVLSASRARRDLVGMLNDTYR